MDGRVVRCPPRHDDHSWHRAALVNSDRDDRTKMDGRASLAMTEGRACMYLSHGEESTMKQSSKERWIASRFDALRSR